LGTLKGEADHPLLNWRMAKLHLFYSSLPTLFWPLSPKMCKTAIESTPRPS